MLRTLGLAAVTLGALLAAWGWRIASHRGLTRTWIRLALVPLGTLLVATALASLPTPAAWPSREELGGVLGLVPLHWAVMLPEMFGLSLHHAQVSLVSALAGCPGSESARGRRLGARLVLAACPATTGK